MTRANVTLHGGSVKECKGWMDGWMDGWMEGFKDGIDEREHNKV